MLTHFFKLAYSVQMLTETIPYIQHKENEAQLGRYLAVVELLNDSFALLVDVAHTNEFCLPVGLEEAAANSLDHSPGGAPAGHAAVLNVPEDAHWREVFRNTGLWRTWWRSSHQAKKQSE